MPRVPQYDPKVRAAPIPGARLTAQTSPDTYGAAVGQGVQNVGQAVLKVQKEEKERADQIAKMASDNQSSVVASDLLNKALATKGQNSFGVVESSLQEYDKSAGEIEAGLSNQEQRTAFRAQSQQRRLAMSSRLQGHVLEQTSIYDREQTSAAVDNLRNDAIANPSDAANKTAQQRQLIQEHATRNGMPPEWTALEAGKAVSDTHLQVLSGLAAAGDEQGASTYHKNFSGELVGKDREAADKIVSVSVTRAQSQRISDDILLKIENGDILTASDAVAAAKAAAGDDAKLRDEAVDRVKVEWATRRSSIDQEQHRRFDQADEMFRDRSSVSDIEPATWSALTASQQDSFRDLERKRATNSLPLDNSDKYYVLRGIAASPQTKNDFLGIDLREYRPQLSKGDYDRLIEIQSEMRKGAGDSKLLRGIDTEEQVVNQLMGEVGINPQVGKADPDPRAISFRAQLNAAVIANQVATGKEAGPEDVKAIGKRLMAEVTISTPRAWYNPARWVAGDDDETYKYFEAPIPAAERDKIVQAFKDEGVSPTDEQIRSAYTATVMGRTRAK